MLQVRNVTKWYGDDCILDGVSFTVNGADRLGLVGPNGCGKTTLLDIIAGKQQADAGSVHFSTPDVRIAYLEQALTYAPGQTAGQVIIAAQGALAEAQQRMNTLGSQLAHARPERQIALLNEYAEAQSRFESLGGYEVMHQMQAILDGLGLHGIDVDTPVETFSGGQKTRLGLACLLLHDPTLLLLDEPTNHLDIRALQWLEGFLESFRGAMIIVSHDRTFLDRTVQTILAIEPLTQKLRAFPGNYRAYITAVQRERRQQERAYREQQEYITRVRGELAKIKGHARRIEQRTIHYHYRKRARKVARAAVVRERRLQRMLDSEQRVEKPALTWKMKADLIDTPISGQSVLALQDLGHCFDERFLFRGVNLQLRRGERVALLGANGSGKTTLLKIIAGEYSPCDGRVRLGASVRLGYYTQEQEGLNDAATALAEIRSVATLSETQARSCLHYFLFAGDDVFLPVSDLSYGEKARLALAKLVVGGCNFLLLDEPINHLDIPSREGFERALSAFAGTVLIVVHDRYFISRYASALWAIQNGSIKRYLDLAEMARVARDTPGTVREGPANLRG